MALFTKNSELSKQKEYVTPKYATGASKIGLQLMGYNKKGEKNTFGKITGTFSPIKAMAQREIAKKIAGDGDTGAIIKGSDKEFYSQKIDQLKVTAKIAAMVASGGSSGAAGDIAGNVAGNAAGDVAGDIAGDVAGDIASDVASDVAGDVASDVAGDVAGDALTSEAGSSLLNKAGSFIGKGGTNQLTNLIGKITGQETPGATKTFTNLLSGKGEGSAMEQVLSGVKNASKNINADEVLNNTKIGSEINQMKTDSEEDKVEMELQKSIQKEKNDTDDKEKELKELQKEEEKVKKDKARKGITSKLSVAGDLIEVGMKTKDYYNAEEREQKKIRNRSVMSNYNLL